MATREEIDNYFVGSKSGKMSYYGNPNYLELLDKDIIWLKNNIKEEINNIFYGFYKNGNIYIIKNSDLEN